jgi:hypothetical protein
MNVDETDFGRHYASLSDEGLLSIHREDLIDTARQCYDQELARRGLQDDRTVIPATPSKELFVNVWKAIRSCAFWYRLPGPVRILSAWIGNFLVAILGTAISEDEFYNFYHPVSREGAYARELIVSIAVAFVLGGLVFYLWQSGAAKWIWVVGVCGLVWFQIGSWGQVPFIPDWLTTWWILSVLAVRTIAYSAGAWVCSAKLFTDSPADIAPQDSPESSPEGSDAP